MPRIEKETAPVEMIGISIKKSEIQEQVGFGLNKSIVDLANGIIRDGIGDYAVKETCAGLILRMARRLKEISTAKDKILKKIKESVADAEKPFKDAYNEIAVLKLKLAEIYSEYDDREKAAEAERIRKKLQEEEDRKAKEKQAKQDLDAEECDADLMSSPDIVPVSKPPVQAAVVPKIEIKTGPARLEGLGTLSITKIQRVRVLNPDLIPVAYKVPSEAKLLEAYKAGVTSIPGAEFYLETSTRSLTK